MVRQGPIDPEEIYRCLMVRKGRRRKSKKGRKESGSQFGWEGMYVRVHAVRKFLCKNPSGGRPGRQAQRGELIFAKPIVKKGGQLEQ